MTSSSGSLETRRSRGFGTALLETLARGFEPQVYYERFQESVRTRSRSTRRAIMFADEDFERFFGEWRKQNNEFYRRFWSGDAAASQTPERES